jgi:hypothetical protein
MYCESNAGSSEFTREMYVKKYIKKILHFLVLIGVVPPGIVLGGRVESQRSDLRILETNVVVVTLIRAIIPGILALRLALDEQ